MDQQDPIIAALFYSTAMHPTWTKALIRIRLESFFPLSYVTLNKTMHRKKRTHVEATYIYIFSESTKWKTTKQKTTR